MQEYLRNTPSELNKERINALVLNEKDNVATTILTLKEGTFAIIQFPDGKRSKIKVLEQIPKHHKLGLSDIRAKTLIIKYGYPIGSSIRDIKKGEHVHAQNMVSEQEAKDR